MVNRVGRYCSISLTLPFDPRLFNGNKCWSTGRVKEIELYMYNGGIGKIVNKQRVVY